MPATPTKRRNHSNSLRYNERRWPPQASRKGSPLKNPLGSATVQIDDSKFLGVVLFVTGIATVALGIALLSEPGTQDSIAPPLTILVGAAGAVSGVGLFRDRTWAKILAGIVAFMLAGSFPIGTAVAAVTFLTLGRSWERSRSRATTEQRAA